MENKFGLGTMLLHGKEQWTSASEPHVTPIYQTSTFTFKTLADAIRQNQNYDQKTGYTYSRFGTPSTDELERKIAALEHAEAGFALGSGMAAISTAMMTLLKGGDHFIAGKIVYGCSHTLFTAVLPGYGVEHSLVDMTDLNAIEAAIKPNTKVIYVETPANPTIVISDIAAISKLAHAHGIKVVVDSTFASPAIQTPIDLGADVVVHSATKYLSGHGTVVAGVMAGTAEFIYNARFPNMQVLGGCLSSMDAWLLMYGMKTLEVRMERHCSNAMAVAEYLEKHPLVERVYYPGLESHPTHEIAKKQMRGYSAMMSFDLKGGFSAVEKFMNSARLISIATSMGNVDSLMQHSPTMSHFGMTAEERREVCIFDNQIRLSVGIENIEDLLADIEQALEKTK